MIGFLKIGLPVILPVLAIIVTELLFLRAIRKRDGELQVFESGVFFSYIVLLYALFPATSMMANGFAYSPLGDGRLFEAQPTPSEVAPIYWLYLLFLAAFAFAYCIFREKRKSRDFLKPTTDKSVFWILLVLYVAIRLFFVFIRVHYNIQEPESYGEAYLSLKGLPLVVQQLANHLGGMALTLQLLLMAFMVFNYSKYRWLILGWLAFEFLGLAFFGVGARSGLFALLLAFAITYQMGVKKLSSRMMALGGVSILLLFVGLGIARAVTDSSIDEGINLLNSSNEFDAMFANAYDLRQLKAAGETRDIYPRFYFADFLNLIPQQVSPFRKLDVGDWYVQTFYPSLADKGGGLAFGVISEGIVGQGWFDVLWRAVILAWSFAFVSRLLLRDQKSFWKYGLYLWATIEAYQCFRNSTFALVPRFVYQFFLVFVIVRAVCAFLTIRKSSEPDATTALGGLQVDTIS